MQTNLPDLPFPYIDIQVLPDYPKSLVKTSPRTYPRSDLTSLGLWTSFATEIHQAIEAAIVQSNSVPGMPLTVGNQIRMPTVVATKEELCVHTNIVLHQAVKSVLMELGIEGRFALSGGGNIAIIGNPDFSWVQGSNQQHPKLVVCLISL